MEIMPRVLSIRKQTNHREICQDVTQAIKQEEHSCLNLTVCLLVLN